MTLSQKSSHAKRINLCLRLFQGGKTQPQSLSNYSLFLASPQTPDNDKIQGALALHFFRIAKTMMASQKSKIRKVENFAGTPLSEYTVCKRNGP
jgi:hypothetical protein